MVDRCAICGGDVGHKINCPEGSAFTTKALADHAMADYGRRRAKMPTMCQVCELPTITDFSFTICRWCHRLLCVDCQVTHPERCSKRPSSPVGPGEKEVDIMTQKQMCQDEVVEATRRPISGMPRDAYGGRNLELRPCRKTASYLLDPPGTGPLYLCTPHAKPYLDSIHLKRISPQAR